MKKKKIAAEELVAKLNSNPEFVAKKAREEDEREKRAGEWRKAEAPLVEELRGAGFDVDSVWDLVNTLDPYPNALPILVRHLQGSYPSRVREGIARALAVPQSKFAWDVLIRQYREEEHNDAKDGLAVAISIIADKSCISEIVNMIRDERHGSSRILLLTALEKSTDPNAMAALMDLEKDPELKEEIGAILHRKHRKR